MAHKNALLNPSNAYAVVPVLLTAKGLRISSSGEVDTRYVDGCALAMRKIQDWYQGQLGRTFNLDPQINFVARRTMSELLVDQAERIDFASTKLLVREAYRDGVLDYCNPTRLFAIMTVGLRGLGGVQFGRNPTTGFTYGGEDVATCAGPPIVVGFGCGIAGGESAVVAGLDPLTEGLIPSSLTADQSTGGLAHEIGHAWGLRHPDAANHGYLAGNDENSGGTVTYGANSMTDTDLNNPLRPFGPPWEVNQWAPPAPLNDLELQADGEAIVIASNTATTITLTANWASQPANGSFYRLGRARALMGIGFYDFPSDAKFYQGEKDHLLNNHGVWFT